MFRKRSRSRDSVSSHTEEQELEIERRDREIEGELGELDSMGMGDIFGPDQTLDPSSYEKTRNHPLGKLLLNALSDTTNLAKKTNTKETENNIKEVCDMFCAHLDLTEDLLDKKIKKNNERFEQELLDKEVDSHKINASIMPPGNWGKHPTLIGNPQKQTAANKAFPGIGKFRGFPREGYMNVVEFLTHLKTAQELCNLSQKEFVDKMISASTGEAHELLSYSRDQNETIEDMFHQLIMRFDDRMTVDEAKTKLQSFKATKSMNLAKIESQIMILAGRSCAQFPVGESRQAYYNMEACQALIRALPPASNITASTVYNTLTARMGKAPTYTYFTRALNTHRTVIDQDVHRSGAEPVRFGKFNQRKGKAMPRTFAIKRPNFNTYSVTMGEPGAAAVSQTPFKNTSMQNNYKKPSPPNFLNKQNTNNYRNNFSSNYTPLNKGRGAQANRGMRRNFGPNRTYSSNTSSQFNRNRTFGRPTTNFNQRRGAGNFRQGTQNNNKCSLCGYSNHKATDCRNIRDDGGNIKQIIPTMGTCTECPKHIFPRLHHPPTYCPFRTGTGIFSKRN
jgi:hypothetical protein